jgi:hypothetical protein
MLLVFSAHLGNQGHIDSASMNPVTLPMSNQPIACIISPTSFKRNFMAYVPFLAGQHLHAAQMALAIMPHKNVCSHFGCDADTLDQWTDSSSFFP